LLTAYSIISCDFGLFLTFLFVFQHFWAEAYGKQHDQALSQGRSQEASLSLDRWAALMTGLGSLAIELTINQSSEIN
jgi:hypothetical protein